jgi:hypothetical protein
MTLAVSSIAVWPQNERRAGIGKIVPVRNARILFIDVIRIDMPVSLNHKIMSETRVNYEFLNLK